VAGSGKSHSVIHYDFKYRFTLSSFRNLQMSKIFLGTAMMSKPPAAGTVDSGGGVSAAEKPSASRVVHALTLEELDRPMHCPEGVDQGSASIRRL
jgi:hypothetical protein